MSWRNSKYFRKHDARVARAGENKKVRKKGCNGKKKKNRKKIVKSSEENVFLLLQKLLLSMVAYMCKKIN